MKKTIGTVRTMMFGGMLAATLSCEGMKIEEFAVLLHESNSYADASLASLWTHYLSRDFDATSEISVPAPGETFSVVSHAALAGKPILLVAMGHLETLTPQNFIDLIAAYHYYGDAGVRAVKTVAESVIQRYGVDGVKSAKSSKGLILKDIIETLEYKDRYPLTEMFKWINLDI